MRSHDSTPHDISLSENKKLQLRTLLLKELLKTKNVAAIEQQLFTLQATVNDVRDIHEVRSLSNFVGIITLIIELANNALEYASAQQILISPQTKLLISTLMTKLTSLRTKNTAQTTLYDGLEEKYLRLVSSSSLTNSPSRIFRSRTGEDLNSFTKTLGVLRDANAELVKKMACFCNSLIKENLLLEKIETQLDYLEKEDIKFYSDSVLILTQQKSKSDLDGYVDVFRQWKNKHKTALASATTLITHPLMQSVYTINSELRNLKLLESYPYLAANEKLIERLSPTAIAGDLRVKHLMEVHSFEEKLDKLYDLQLDKIRANRQRFLARNHLRKRSKSTNDFHQEGQQQKSSPKIHRHSTKEPAASKMEKGSGRHKHKSVMISSKKHEHVLKRSMSQGQLLFSQHERKKDQAEEKRVRQKAAAVIIRK